MQTSSGPLPTAIGDIPWPWLLEERFRIQTFINYPANCTKSSLQLAANGFVYIGSGRNGDDSVMCYNCGLTKKDWQISDNVENVHLALSPSCPIASRLRNDDGSLCLSSFSAHCDKPTQPSSPGSQTNEPNLSVPSASSSNSLRPTSTVTTATPLTSGYNVLRPTTSVTIAAPLTSDSTFLRPTPSLANNTVASPSDFDHLMSDPSNTHSPQTLNNIQPSDSDINFPITPSREHLSNQIVTNISAVQSSTGSTEQTHTPHTAGNESMPQNAPSTNHTGHVGEETTSINALNTQNKQNPTYAELAIITERPKKPEFAMRQKRLDSFSRWPEGHFITKEDLVNAGFYYAGYGDCGRCFYCGGGLRNWDDDDNVLVEHARWFPKCPFMRQLMGQAFINAVQELNRYIEKISLKMVTERAGASACFSDSELSRDPAVRSLVDLGYSQKDVMEMAERVRAETKSNIVSADQLLELLEPKCYRSSVQHAIENNELPVTINELKGQNQELRQQTLCKICLDKEVQIVFLPCGHLVTCVECSLPLKDCPICRRLIKGTVRAFMS
ncbi:unnamed protein product [Lymnaea stagnalis]|uniref:RING-type domain-containing protein n=1 Tax=Lymnaea stagnalis TaxID=6523 RepID=A0AAV2H5G8_LYMST